MLRVLHELAVHVHRKLSPRKRRLAVLQPSAAFEGGGGGVRVREEDYMATKIPAYV